MPDEQVVDSVAINNLKAISEQPALISNLAYSNAVSSNNLGQQNAVSNQQAGNELAVSLVAKATKTVSDPGPLEARSAVNVLSNNELAQTIAGLKSSVEAFTRPGGFRHAGKGHAVEAFVGSRRAHADKEPSNLDLKIDKQGRLVISRPVPTIFIPEKVSKEDIQVEFGDDGVTIHVKTTG